MAYNHTTGDGERIFSPVYADVWETNLKNMNGADVKVYIALLMHTTQHDRTWFMSIDEMAEDAGVSRSTAAAAKDRLVDAGLFTQAWRYRNEAGDYHLTDTRPPPRMQGKNVYKVNVKPTFVESENHHDSGDRVRKSESIESENRTLVESENRNPTRAPSPEPPTRAPLMHGSSESETAKPSRNDYPDAFNEFWFAYPKAGRNAKKPAFKAWQKAVKTTDPSVILSGAKRYAADPNRSDAFTKWAQGWLNDGRWEDVQQPARNTAQNGRGGANNAPVGYRPITAQERSILEFEAMKDNYHPMVVEILNSGMIPRNFNMNAGQPGPAVDTNTNLSIGA